MKKRQQDEMPRDYVQQKGYQIVERWKCEWWCSLYKSDESLNSHLRENFRYRRLLRQEQLLLGIFNARLYGYVPSDIEVPEQLHDYFSNFLPINKNTVVSRNDFGNLLKQYVENENIMVQPRYMLILGLILTNGIITTPSLLFYLQLCIVCKKIHWFVQYTPRKCFDNFVQSAEDARRQRVGQIAKLRVMSPLVDKKEMISSLWMEFVIILTLFLKLWAIIISTAPVKKHVPL